MSLGPSSASFTTPPPSTTVEQQQQQYLLQQFQQQQQQVVVVIHVGWSPEIVVRSLLPRDDQSVEEWVWKFLQRLPLESWNHLSQQQLQPEWNKTAHNTDPTSSAANPSISSFRLHCGPHFLLNVRLKDMSTLSDDNDEFSSNPFIATVALRSQLRMTSTFTYPYPYYPSRGGGGSGGGNSFMDYQDSLFSPTPPATAASSSSDDWAYWNPTDPISQLAATFTPATHTNPYSFQSPYRINRGGSTEDVDDQLQHLELVVLPVSRLSVNGTGQHPHDGCNGHRSTWYVAEPTTTNGTTTMRTATLDFSVSTDPSITRTTNKRPREVENDNEKVGTSHEHEDHDEDVVEHKEPPKKRRRATTLDSSSLKSIGNGKTNGSAATTKKTRAQSASRISLAKKRKQEQQQPAIDPRGDVGGTPNDEEVRKEKVRNEKENKASQDEEGKEELQADKASNNSFYKLEGLPTSAVGDLENITLEQDHDQCKKEGVEALESSGDKGASSSSSSEARRGCAAVGDPDDKVVAASSVSNDADAIDCVQHSGSSSSSAPQDKSENKHLFKEDSTPLRPVTSAKGDASPTVPDEENGGLVQISESSDKNQHMQSTVNEALLRHSNPAPDEMNVSGFNPIIPHANEVEREGGDSQEVDDDSSVSSSSSSGESPSSSSFASENADNLEKPMQATELGESQGPSPHHGDAGTVVVVQGTCGTKGEGNSAETDDEQAGSSSSSSESSTSSTTRSTSSALSHRSSSAKVLGNDKNGTESKNGSPTKLLNSPQRFGEGAYNTDPIEPTGPTEDMRAEKADPNSNDESRSVVEGSVSSTSSSSTSPSDSSSTSTSSTTSSSSGPSPSEDMPQSSVVAEATAVIDVRNEMSSATPAINGSRTLTTAKDLSQRNSETTISKIHGTDPVTEDNGNKPSDTSSSSSTTSSLRSEPSTASRGIDPCAVTHSKASQSGVNVKLNQLLSATDRQLTISSQFDSSQPARLAAPDEMNATVDTSSVKKQQEACDNPKSTTSASSGGSSASSTTLDSSSDDANDDSTSSTTTSSDSTSSGSSSSSSSISSSSTSQTKANINVLGVQVDQSQTLPNGGNSTLQVQIPQQEHLPTTSQQTPLRQQLKAPRRRPLLASDRPIIIDPFYRR